MQTIQESSKHDPLQLVVLADFFSKVELRGNGLSLDSCVRLLPLLDTVLSTNEHSRNLSGSGTLKPASDHIAGAVIRALLFLCRGFGEVISSTREGANLNKNAFVDIKGEERLKKCNVCHANLMRVRNRIDMMKLTYAHNKGFVRDLAQFYMVTKGL